MSAYFCAANLFGSCGIAAAESSRIGKKCCQVTGLYETTDTTLVHKLGQQVL